MALRHYLILLLFIFGFTHLSGQMIQEKDTLIGNEWITYGQKYFKFVVDADGIYRIPYTSLAAAGISAEAIGSELRIYSMGKQVPLHVSTDGVFGPDDYIEFYGYKNRGELDRYLFRKPDVDMLNTGHSMYTDRRAYYLTTVGADIPQRVNTLTNNVSTPPAPESYYLHKEIVSFTGGSNDPYFPIDGGGAVSYSSYLHAEGFCKNAEPNSTTQVNTSERTSGPDAILHLRMTSTNHGEHEFVVTWNGEVLDTIMHDSIEISDVSYSLPLAKIQDINQLNISNTNALSRHSLVSVTLTYPRLIKTNGASEFEITLAGNTADRYIVIDGFVHNGSSPLVYSADGLSRMISNLNGNNQVHFVWPGDDQEISLRISDPLTAVTPISTLEEKVFTDFSDDNTEYIIITHPDLMEPGTESEYIQYRSSTVGGAYQAKAYSILDLYEQFGYGVEKHPQAVRNFVEFFDRNWPSAKMIFIVGRAIEYNHSRYESGTWESNFFVPTFGRPGADNLLAATLWNLVPRYPIGRLAVVDRQGIDIYLDKVKEHDVALNTPQTLEAKSWIKNIMHIGGGQKVSEQHNFKSILNSLATEITASDFGAKVTSFNKESTDVIGESDSKQIEKLLKEGLTLINYLGHSSASSFEFNINDPAEWNNKGRYPIFSAMGCSAGQIHGTIFSLSDRYVQIKDEGSIAFISGSGSQFATALTAWARPWYNSFGNLEYGITLGESILVGLQALSNYIVIDRPTTSNSYRYLLEQQTFQGDPALRLHPFPGPDYLLDRQSVSISPDILNTKIDSFDLQFSIFNIGRNLRQQVGYKVSIKSPDGQLTTLTEGNHQADYFESPVTLRLPLLINGKSGLFRILIEVDPAQQIEELPSPDAESNNHLLDNLNVEGIEFAVVDNVMTAVYPPDYAIVKEAQPTLVATSSNAFSAEQQIIVELDTNALFNSPSKIRDVIPNQIGALKWTPSFPLTPGQEYFWRVSTDSISPELSYNWSRHSFIYLPESSPGWNQSHFHQLTGNAYDQIVPDSLNRSFLFDRKVINYRMLNRYHDVPLGLVPFFFEDGKFNAKLAQRFRDKKVHGFVVAIDSITGNYIMNPPPGLYGSVPDPLPMEGFAYDLTTAESRQNLINLIENVIPPGYFVFFYTYQHTGFPVYNPEEWEADEAQFGKSIFSVIEQQFPGSGIRSLATKGSVPYIVLFQKDRFGIEEQMAATVDDVISISFDGGSFLTEGNYISVPVGPASKWGTIEHSLTAGMNDTTGMLRLSAWALNQDHTDTLYISEDITDAVIDISHLNAEEYPYVQLCLYTLDSVSYDPGEVDYWRVLYEGYPECLINTSLGFEFNDDTLRQGETMMMRTYIENVSGIDVDTLPVSLRLINKNNEVVEISQSIQPLLKNSVAEIQFQQNTGELFGDYRVIMELNPNRTIREHNYTNNIGILPMHIIGDDVNPLLDVTFDGVHIQDGDLVAAKPLIRIQLHLKSIWSSHLIIIRNVYISLKTG
jgi:hypothetical protein